MKRMKQQSGQSSIELIIIVSLAVVLCFLVLSRFSTLQDSIFTSASARQALINQMGQMDSNYNIIKINEAECDDSIRVNVQVSQVPNAGDQIAISKKVEAGVISTRNIGGKFVSVFFNEPVKLLC